MKDDLPQTPPSVTVPAPLPAQPHRKHELLAEIEELAERFLGGRAAQIKAKVGELRRLL